MKTRIFAAKSPTIIEFVLLGEGEWQDKAKRGPHGLPVYITPDIVRASVPMFADMPVQGVKRKSGIFDHMPEAMKAELSGRGLQHLVDETVGFIRNPRIETVDGKLAAVGEVHFHDENVAATLRAAAEAQDFDFMGGSFDGRWKEWKVEEFGGQRYDTFTLESIDTWDLANFPAGNSRMYRLAASRNPQHGDSEMTLTAKQRAILIALMSTAGVKPDALEKVFGDGADFLKESFAAMRSALVGKTDTLARFEAIVAKIEKNEEVDNQFTALGSFKIESATAAVQAVPDPVKDPAVQQANDILKQAEAAQKAAEAAQEKVETVLGEAEIEQRVTAAANLPEVARAEVKKRLKASRTYSPDAIKAAIDAELKYLASATPDAGYASDFRISASAGENEVDRILLAVEGMFAKEDLKNSKKESVPRIWSLKQLNRLCGSVDDNPERLFHRLAAGLNALFNEGSPGLYKIVEPRTGRITASLVSSDLSTIFGTALYRQYLRNYASPDWQTWRTIAEIVPFSDLRARNFQQFGQYPAAPSVSEGGTYTEVTSPSGQQVSMSITKYGDIESFTQEMVIQDDIRTIALIPQRMGEGMAKDVYYMVFDLITTNAAVAIGSDTATLIHANHSNGSASGGSALSDSTLDSAWQRMIAQVGFGGSSSRDELGVGNAPRYLLVGRAQYLRALALTQPERLAQQSAATDQYPTGYFMPDAGIPNYRRGIEPILLPHVSSSTNWWAAAAPMNTPGILVGFLNGQDTPEIVTEPSNTGSNFTADKVRLKRKLWRGAAVADYRAFDGQIA